jgi:large subunit ribosomal protein L34e
MTRPSRRSRTFRRVHVKTPGARSKLDYRKRKPGKAVCAVCYAPLHGVPRERPYKLRKLSKSGKRPQRTFGGVMCSKCSRRELIRKARK